MAIDCKTHAFKDVKKNYCPACLKAEFSKDLDVDSVVNRIVELVNNPGDIRQDSFGVCGVTSILYGLLKRRPGRMEDLCVATFCGTPFKMLPSKKEVKIDLANLLKLYKGGKPTDKKYFVDYLAARALGQILKTENKPLYAKQKVEFNSCFVKDPDPMDAKDYKKVTAKGDLGLRTEALDWILKSVIGTDSCVSHTAMNEAGFGEFVKGVKTANSLTLVAMKADFIYNFESDKKTVKDRVSGPLTVASTSQYAPGAAYDHWIVVDKIDEKGADYEVSYWTWGQPIKVQKIAKSVTHTYLPDAITAVIKAS